MTDLRFGEIFSLLHARRPWQLPKGVLAVVTIFHCLLFRLAVAQPGFLPSLPSLHVMSLSRNPYHFVSQTF